MYENKGKATGWIKPLLDHSTIHGIGTLIILIIHELFVPTPWYILFLPFFDIATHFITDRWKATRPDGPDNYWFWHNLGIDQMLHHLVGIIIIWNIV